jgi:hypothetical protein
MWTYVEIEITSMWGVRTSSVQHILTQMSSAGIVLLPT